MNTINEVRAILNNYKNIAYVEHRQNYFYGVYEIDIIFIDDTFEEIEIENEENRNIGKLLELDRWDKRKISGNY